jgi:thiol-disulfide isomerase/thioredoxin
MKKSLLVLLNLLAAQMISGQADSTKINPPDPFCRMIKKINALNTVSFTSRLSEKQVFEVDTAVSYAKVLVIKQGKTISFLQIILEKGGKELVFLNDSSWITDHNAGTITNLGKGIDHLTHNHLSDFFPFSVYDIDTTICKVEPFWKIIKETKEYSVVSLDISNSAKELSDSRAEFTIGNSDFLLHRILKEAVYLKADNYFQEVDFNGYDFPEPGQVVIPAYFYTYTKNFSMVRDTLPAEVKKKEDNQGEVYLKNPDLYDLSGKSVSLPQDGLVFFDLWYVGCPPCMKSAPVIEKLYNEYKDKVYFFSVNEADRDTAKIERFKEKMGITFPLLIGGKDKLAEKVTGGSGYPVFILMDAESGKVLWTKKGYAENLEEQIKAAIKQNL